MTEALCGDPEDSAGCRLMGFLAVEHVLIIMKVRLESALARGWVLIPPFGPVWGTHEEGLMYRLIYDAWPLRVAALLISRLNLPLV
jgi:hypothetical protein